MAIERQGYAMFDAFREAKRDVDAAAASYRQTCVEARNGDKSARRRYRAALRRYERAIDALRHLRMVP